MPKTNLYLKEYRTLLEKLIESQIKLAQCKDIDMATKQKLEKQMYVLIGNLMMYFNNSVKKSLKKIERYNEEETPRYRNN